MDITVRCGAFRFYDTRDVCVCLDRLMHCYQWENMFDTESYVQQ